MTNNFLKFIPDFFEGMHKRTAARNQQVVDLLNALIKGTAEERQKASELLEKDPTIRKTILNEDTIDVMHENKIITGDVKATSKEIFANFFGMNENWSLTRNIQGALMVHCPEWPTYFIPAYTQAKATGDASDLKKGEGPRGLLTGALEGLAVGALVSGKSLKPREMVPYIILGAGLQLFSSKLFPWVGEKLGRYQYNKNIAKSAKTNTDADLFVKDKDNPFAHPKPDPAPLPKADSQQPIFNGSNASSATYKYFAPVSSRMKI